MIIHSGANKYLKPASLLLLSSFSSACLIFGISQTLASGDYAPIIDASYLEQHRELLEMLGILSCATSVLLFAFCRNKLQLLLPTGIAIIFGAVTATTLRVASASTFGANIGGALALIAYLPATIAILVLECLLLRRFLCPRAKWDQTEVGHGR